MDAGNKVREISNHADVLALYAASQIGRQRNTAEPAKKKVHVLLSLKRPEEIEALRLIYGGGFFLIGLYASPETRLAHLKTDLNITKTTAEKLMSRDQDEEDPWGQKTRATFHMSDVFVNLGSNINDLNRDVHRF